MTDILNISAIPASRRAKAKLNFLAYQPNTKTVDDPDWVDPEDGSSPDQIPKYTDLEWLNETVWLYLIKCNKKGQAIRNQQASEPVENIRTQ